MPYGFDLSDLTQIALRERLDAADPEAAKRVRWITDVILSYAGYLATGDREAGRLSTGDRVFLESIEGAMLLLIERARDERTT